MKSLFLSSVLIVLFSYGLSYEPCPNSKICSSQGIIIEACYDLDSKSLTLNSWTEEKEFYSLYVSEIHQDSNLLGGCPEVLRGQNLTLKFDSEYYSMERVLIDREEMDLVMLSYNNILHKTKFDEQLEKMRLQKMELLAEIIQLQGKIGI